MDPTPPTTPSPDSDQRKINTTNQHAVLPDSISEKEELSIDVENNGSNISGARVAHDGPHFRKQRCHSDLSFAKQPIFGANQTVISVQPFGSGMNISSAGSSRRRGSVEGICCANCKTTTTPMWRRGLNGDNLCNACGLYFRNHGMNRPIQVTFDGTVTHASRTRKISLNKKAPASLSSSTAGVPSVLSKPLMTSRSPVLSSKSVGRMFAKRNSAPCIFTMFQPPTQPQPLSAPHGLNPFAIKIGDGVVINMTPRQDSRRYALVAALHVDEGVVTDFFASWLDIKTEDGHPPIHTLPSGERVISVSSMPSVTTDMLRTVPVSCIVDRFTLHVASQTLSLPSYPFPYSATNCPSSLPSLPSSSATMPSFTSTSLRSSTDTLVEQEYEEDQDVVAASILLKVRGGIN